MGSDAPIDAAALGEFPLLAGVGLAAREELLKVAEQRKLSTGEVILRQGTQNTKMYLVIGGRLGVYLAALEAEPVAKLGPGDTVGELSVLDEQPVSATVAALEPSRVLVLDSAVFWSLLHESHAFTLNLLVKLAGRLRANNATVTENVEQRRRFERAALFDGLTGVRNRRWLDETLNRLSRRHQESKSNLSVAMIDIDHFKQFNDRFGHAAGDHVLTVVARLMSKNLRPSDLVARFGGEEFVIIFPGSALASAQVAAERVRAAVESAHLGLPSGVDLPTVTVSIGVTQLRENQTVADFLLEADQAMYRAKSAGRNRVVGSS